MATNTHPGNDYYVYTLTGSIQRQSNPILATALKAAGWAGPYTWNQAQQVLASGQTAKQAVTGAANDTGISGLINFIKQGSIWERAGEVLVGVVILYIGLKAMATPQSAPNIAKQGVRTTAKHIAKAVVK
jgi:hypothetical protein